jgi:hypothetical protein
MRAVPVTTNSTGLSVQDSGDVPGWPEIGGLSFGNGGRASMDLWQCYGAKLHARQSYGSNHQNAACGQKQPNRHAATTPMARIWVQDGKIMGFVAISVH